MEKKIDEEKRTRKRRHQRFKANATFFLFVALLLLVGFALGRMTAAAKEPGYPVRAVGVHMPDKQWEKAAALSRLTYHGSCRITAYCSCEICCGQWAGNRPLDENGDPIVYGSSGEELIPGVSVACSLPYGTKLQIDGLPGTYIVQDHTAEWVQDRYNGMTVDIYMDSHGACYELLAGMPEWMDVYIIEEAEA